MRSYPAILQVVRPALFIDPAIRNRYVLRSPEPGTALVWDGIFGGTGPGEIEVGSGKGRFLVEAAVAAPATRFLAVEIKARLVAYIAGRLDRHRIDNARVLHGDGLALLRDHVPPASVSAIHVYFPDPWWKKPHRKRRLYTPEFLAACDRALAEGGRLHLASDVAGVFEGLAAAAETTGFRAVAESDPFSAQAGTGPSNFECKAISGGRAIRRAIYIRSRPGGS